jgi:uncharacterized protein YggE
VEATDKDKGSGVKTASTKAVTVRVNPWWLSGALALCVVGMLLMWRPWAATTLSVDRTVSVNGSATLTAEPDEYVFYPNYEFKNADKAVGLKELTAKSDEVVAGLKKAGVPDKDIKTNASGYRDFYLYNEQERTHVYSLQVTATVDNRAAAQKVQDYLLTTNPSGAVTPQAAFSKTKQKELEAKGRDEATKEARAKAEQQAKNLGFRVGRVKSVQDSSGGYGAPEPMMAIDSVRASGTSEKALAVQPGQNDLTYTVQVTYYIK